MEKKVKKSFTCAKVNDYCLNNDLVFTYTPKAGDVGIFRVIDADDNYLASSYLVDPDGINRTLFHGDFVMLAFGNRYATSQLEGYVPRTPTRRCHLIGRGGVAGVLKSVSAAMKIEPTMVELVGYATDAFGKVINTIQSEKLDPFNPAAIHSKVILSIGSSMDSGKTTTAAFLCGGLNAAGYSTAYLKLTGTAFPKDARYVFDRGADFIADFTHFGYPSTFLCEHWELLNIYQSLIQLAQAAVKPDYIVVEIADGILQRETAMLLRDRNFMSTVHSVILSCGDSLGVLTGIKILEELDIQPFAISGLFTASDLLIEEVEGLTNIPILRLKELLEGQALTYLQAKNFELLQPSLQEIA